MRIPFISHWRTRRNAHDTALIALLDSADHMYDEMPALRGQVEELVTYVRRREQVMIAAHALADKFDDNWLASQVADCMSDAELEPLLDLFHATGRPDAAEMWRGHHSADEDDPDPFAEDENEIQDQPTAA